MIDWGRIAEPHDDGSDTADVLALVLAAGYMPIEAVRNGLFGAPVKTTLDFVPKVTDIVIDAIDDGFKSEVDVLIGLWPAMDSQMNRLLQAVYPMVHSAGRRSGFGGSYGTRDQDVAQHFGQIYATTDTTHAFAEGLVSSLANWKLYAMGIKTLSWGPELLTNAPGDLIKTPTREELKPAGVVLHAAYAIMHVMQFNLHVAGFDDDSWSAHAKYSIGKQLERLNRMVVTFDSFTCTADGALFIAALRDWNNRMITEAQQWR